MSVKHIHINRIIQLLFAVLVLSLISGCGFKLRGSDQSQQMVTPVKIAGVIPGSPFYRTLQRFLTTSDSTTATLAISEYRLIHRRLTLSAVAGPQLYSSRLSLKATYTDTSGVEVWAAVPIEVEREYSFDSTNPVGLNDYQQQVTRQMMETSAMALGRRIALSQKQASQP
jgi:outer membrane lipopolysaccharide assembly protein LptE/RlpB